MAINLSTNASYNLACTIERLINNNNQMYKNVIEYRKNEKRIFKHTERKHWVNGLQVRGWGDWNKHPEDRRKGRHYCYAFTVKNLAFIVSWVKYFDSFNLVFFKPSTYLLKD